jgi:hypothetical protein
VVVLPSPGHNLAVDDFQRMFPVTS